MNKKFSIIISVLFLTCFLCVLIQPVSPQTNFETKYTIEKAEIIESNAKTYLTSTHSIRPDVDEKFSLYNRGSKYVSLTSDSYNVIVEKILNGYEYTLVINSPDSLKYNVVSFEVDTKGYTVTQDGSLLTELPKKDYKVWNETYAFDGQNETRKDISLVGCLRFIPDGKITEEFIIKRPYIYDANLVGVFGTQKLEGNTLTVSIPQEFLINARFPIFVDPTYIFSDGFESGDFSAWTYTVIIGETSSFEVVNNSHHGSYKANAKTTTISPNGAYAVKSIGSSAITYTRAYFKINNLILQEYEILGLIVLGDTWDKSCRLQILNYNGTLRWQLAVIDTEIFVNNHTVTVPLEEWICVELLRDITNNEQKVWIDGVLTLSTTEVLTSNSTQVQIGIYEVTGVSVNCDLDLDCVVVSDSYIGLEESTPTPTPDTTIQPTSTPLPTNEGYQVFEILLLTVILVVINIVGLGFRVPLLNLVALIFSFTFIIIFEVSNMSILLIAINCLVSVACLSKNLYGRDK